MLQALILLKMYSGHMLGFFGEKLDCVTIFIVSPFPLFHCFRMTSYVGQSFVMHFTVRLSCLGEMCLPSLSMSFVLSSLVISSCFKSPDANMTTMGGGGRNIQTV